jgi:inositol oxygenase
MEKGKSENLPKVSKPLSDLKKYQNLDKAKLLEKIDDDIQELNLLKYQLRQQLDDNNSIIQNDSNDDNNNNNNNNNNNTNNNNINSKKSSNKSLNSELQIKNIENNVNWKDNSNSEIIKNSNTRQYRQYELAFDRVKLFYKEQHENQTVGYNIQARINFKTKIRDRMTVWDALIKLNNLLDESDPDTQLSQIDHALQTAEAIRKDNKPRWFQLVGLIHDLGKLLYFFDSKGQWDVVGDTFPVGCKFSKKIIYYDYFKNNPDLKNPLYNTKYGLYSPHCGLDNVMLSWGHDEYMYHLAKEQTTLPPEALAMIRYHSFYPWHSEGAYKYLMNEKDKELLECVQAFNPYDLYSKTDIKYDIEELKPYYLDLIDEFFPNKIVEF